MGKLSVAQTVVAVAVIVCATISAIFKVVSGHDLESIYLVIGGYALGYINGHKTSLTTLAHKVDKIEEKVE